MDFLKPEVRRNRITELTDDNPQFTAINNQPSIKVIEEEEKNTETIPSYLINGKIEIYLYTRTILN